MTTNATPSDATAHWNGADVTECLMTMMAATVDDLTVLGPVSCVAIELRMSEVGQPELVAMATSGGVVVRHVFNVGSMSIGLRDPLEVDLSPGRPGIMIIIDRKLHVPALKSILRHARAKKRTAKDVISWTLSDQGLRVVQDDLDVLIPARRFKEMRDDKEIESAYPWDSLHQVLDDAHREDPCPFPKHYDADRIKLMISVLEPAGEAAPVTVIAGPRMLALRPAGNESDWGSIAHACAVPLAI